MSANECVPLFPEPEIPRLLELVLDHAGTLRKIHNTEREDHVSDRLVKRIRLDRRMRACPFSILREFRVFNDELDVAGHSGSIDICFICAGGDRTYFAIEAKRLHVTFPSGWQSLVSEYVTGDQGMMCFVTSKYSETQQAGAMLGYVFDGEIEKARNTLSTLIEQHAELLRVDGTEGLAASAIVSRQERVDETKHRFGQRNFTIYHLLVPV